MPINLHYFSVGKNILPQEKEKLGLGLGLGFEKVWNSRMVVSYDRRQPMSGADDDDG